MIQIKHRYTDAVLFECEAENLKVAVEQAVAAGANLGGANLGDANLHGANLHGANLHGAYLSRVSLCGATIDGARLNADDIGGPGEILWALTPEESEIISRRRAQP